MIMRLSLFVVMALLLSADHSVARDRKRPTIQITLPTSMATYTTTAVQLLIGGTARDNVGVITVTWRNTRGGSGTAEGTTSWFAMVPLQAGTNEITCTAVDAAQHTRTDVLTVSVMSPPPPPGPITLEWSYDGTTGDVFQIERCTITPETCPMGPLTSVGLVERQWIDTAVAAESDYCYRLAVVTQGQLGAYSNTLCSP